MAYHTTCEPDQSEQKSNEKKGLERGLWATPADHSIDIIDQMTLKWHNSRHSW